MARTNVWHGTAQEAADLLAAIERHCTCAHLRGARVTTCPALNKSALAAVQASSVGVAMGVYNMVRVSGGAFAGAVFGPLLDDQLAPARTGPLHRPVRPAPPGKSAGRS